MSSVKVVRGELVRGRGRAFAVVWGVFGVFSAALAAAVRLDAAERCERWTSVADQLIALLPGRPAPGTLDPRLAMPTHESIGLPA